MENSSLNNEFNLFGVDSSLVEFPFERKANPDYPPFLQSVARDSYFERAKFRVCNVD